MSSPTQVEGNNFLYFPPRQKVWETMNVPQSQLSVSQLVSYIGSSVVSQNSFLVFFYVFRFAMKIYWDYRFASSFMTLRASFNLASYTFNRFLRRSLASMMYFLCFTFQTNDKYIIRFLHHHTCGLDFDCMVMSLLTSLPKQLQFFQLTNHAVKVVSDALKKFFYFEKKNYFQICFSDSILKCYYL